jgi:membrane-bound transcription factor site-1 protease
VSLTYASVLWPWSGYLGVKLEIGEEASDYDGLVEGEIRLSVESKLNETVNQVSKLKLFVRARVIPRPPRKQRLIWDQYHNLRYPPGYFPRDDLRAKNDPLDWNADHVMPLI